MFRKSLLPLLMLLIGAPSHGGAVYILNSPLAWKLENYIGGPVVVWNTSAPCTGGMIGFGPSATLADINRFWATVAVAKTSGRKMFIRYDDGAAPNSCPILSFGLDIE